MKIDFDAVNIRDPNTESVIALEELMEDAETTPLALNILAKDATSTKTLQQRLARITLRRKNRQPF